MDCDFEGVLGLSDTVWLRFEWKREKKLGASGVEGGESMLEEGEIGEVDEEEDVDVVVLWEKGAGRETERVIVAGMEGAFAAVSVVRKSGARGMMADGR